MASSLLRALTRGKEVVTRAVPAVQKAASQRLFSTAVEEDVVKAAFMKQQSQFRQYLQGLAQVNIPLNPDDDKAVMQYADNVRKLREKVGMKSFTEKLADTLESAEEESQDVRSFLHDASLIRRQLGVDDSVGVESLMFAALDSVEKKIGKPLTTADAQGLQAFQTEMAAVNSKLGVKESDLEKLEGELDVMLARGQIEQLRNEALEKINTYKRRDALDGVDIDVKELKPTAYL